MTTVHHQTRLASSKQSLKTVFINEEEKQPHVDTVLQQFTSFQNRMSDLENSVSNLIDHRFTKLEITYLTRKLECLQHSNRDSIHDSIKSLRVSVVLLHCKNPKIHAMHDNSGWKRHPGKTKPPQLPSKCQHQNKLTCKS